MTDKKGPQITLNEDTVLGLVEEAKDLLAKIDSFRTERKALEASTLGTLLEENEDVQYVSTLVDEGQVAIDYLTSLVTEGNLWISQQVAEAIDKVHKGVSLDTLREQAAEKANRAKVIADMLGLEVEIPNVPTKVSTTSTPGKSSGTKVSNARYYRVIDGEKVYQAASQNSLSSLAWFYSQPGHPDGDRMGVADFLKHLEANGLDAKSMAKPWGPIDVGLNKKGELVQVGMDVTDEKASTEDEAKQD